MTHASPHVLPPLPYPEIALQPVISASTVSLHYGKHHRGYVDTLNKLITKTPYADMTLEQIITEASAKPADTAIFNNAAQTWNHTFYWNSLRPAGSKPPPAALDARIRADFGGIDELKKQLAAAATGQFGSGWVWLVSEGNHLKIVKTANAANPLTLRSTPLLTIDVWEHAYYLDYQNRRVEHVNALFDQLINWEFAAANLR